ncbi:hypothetical protein Syn7502_01475 [Synechococcus sp. PCC 7502]|uniref:DUF6887 family protein n=1 Tax=Synechococcus sp. PCC 7502 TaxID=1173263 RepID=UPI00029F8581|nr:hypothetical protein [Synechococcus sp. PCC 7502]AFY73543.1 hypothetical protein Syn7502_01475 [Synechococcus sp. PCC 7502]
MKPNLKAMTKPELKSYLLEHRNDIEAFEALMDKVNSEPDQKFYPPEEASNLSKLLERSPTQQTQ